MGLFFYTKKGSIISTVDLPTTEIIEPFKKPIISSVVACLIGFFECFGAFLGHNQYFSSIFVTSVFIF